MTQQNKETYVEFLERRSTHMSRIIGNLEGRLKVILDTENALNDSTKLRIEQALEKSESMWREMQDYSARPA